MSGANGGSSVSSSAGLASSSQRDSTGGSDCSSAVGRWSVSAAKAIKELVIATEANEANSTAQDRILTSLSRGICRLWKTKCVCPIRPYSQS